MHPYRRRGSAAVVVLLALPGARPGAEAQTRALAVGLTPLTAAPLPSPLASSPVADSASGEWDGAAAGAAVGSWLGAGLVGAAVTDMRSGALVGSALGPVAGAALATQVDPGAGNAGTPAFLLTHSVITVVFGNAGGRPEAGP